MEQTDEWTKLMDAQVQFQYSSPVGSGGEQLQVYLDLNAPRSMQ